MLETLQMLQKMFVVIKTFSKSKEMEIQRS